MAVGGHSGAGRAMSMPAQSVAAGAASTSAPTPAPTTATAVKATAITMGLHALCTVAMVVPFKHWQVQQGQAVKVDGILALRGTGAGLWPRGAASAVAQLRNEWQD